MQQSDCPPVAPSIEIISVETFADRMEIGETTVWKWIRSGKLRPGRHYIKIERVIRFAWGQQLIDRLLEDCLENDEPGDMPEPKDEDKPKQRSRNASSPLNVNY